MPYESAKDMPSVIELNSLLSGYRLLQFLAPKSKRIDYKGIRKQVDHTTSTVDDFYALLGPRYWVFHDNLSVEHMAEIVSKHHDDPDATESALIAYYQDEDLLRFWARNLFHRQAMKSRQHLIEHALDDYFSGRYYAVVHVLLSVMDGYVNDTDIQLRKGLHARKAEDVDAWDSVVGHHQGLTHAHATFQKGFRATDESETFELYRNGIVHGTLLNYNNVVVATKAWNRLFAVVDWSRAEEKRNKPVEPKPTFSQTMKQISEYAATRAEIRKQLDAFRPVVLSKGDAGLVEHPAYAACTEFLTFWQKPKPNYGGMAKMLASLSKNSAGEVRNDYNNYRLNRFEIISLDHGALAACDISVRLTINDKEYEHFLRWIFEDQEGEIASADAKWRVITFGPHVMMA